MADMKERKQAWQDVRLSFLPEDMVLDILVKLPTKTLLRFKCLSTRIRILIRSPNFVAAHIQHQRTGIFLLARRSHPDKTNKVCGFPWSWPFLHHQQNRLVRLKIYQNGTNDHSSIRVSCLSFPFLKKKPNWNYRRWLQYVGSWNGLVCLNVCEIRSQPKMVLWNPATSNFCFAPPPPPPPMIDFHRRPVYGFGYDSVSDDYKSVRIVKPVGGPAEAVVLSWRKRSWKNLTDDEIKHERLVEIRPYPMTSKGRVNWMVSTTEHSGMLLSFKLDEERFEWISLPPKDCCYKYGQNRTACVWKGSLAMLVGNRTTNVCCRNTLWLFEECNDDRHHGSCCWSKLFTIGTDFWSKRVSELPEYIWGIDVWHLFLVYQYDDRLALAALTEKLRPQFGYHIRRGFEFAATLVPVPGSST